MRSNRVGHAASKMPASSARNPVSPPTAARARERSSTSEANLISFSFPCFREEACVFVFNLISFLNPPLGSGRLTARAVDQLAQDHSHLLELSRFIEEEARTILQTLLAILWITMVGEDD